MSVVNKDSAVDMTNSPQEELEKKHTSDDSFTANDTIATTKAHDDIQTIEGPDSLEVVDSLKLSFNEPVEQQQNTEATSSPCPSEDTVLVIIMSSSIINKDVTIKGLEQDGYTILDQQSLQLTSSQIDTLYAYDTSATKPHYQQLYDGWKQTCASDPVQVVLLGKENAVQSFQALVANQNCTKKKNRLLDPQSVYASTSQENVKRDINMLLGTQGSNTLGESVSSATMDDTVAQTSSETMGGATISTEGSDQEPPLLPISDNTATTNDHQEEPAVMDESVSDSTPHLDNQPTLSLTKETEADDTPTLLEATTKTPFDEETTITDSTLLEPETTANPLLAMETTTTDPTSLEMEQDKTTSLTSLDDNQAESSVSSHSLDSDNQLTESTGSLPSQADEGMINNEVSVSNESTKQSDHESRQTPAKPTLDSSSDNTSNHSSNEEQETTPIDDSIPSTKAAKSHNDNVETKKTPIKKKDAGPGVIKKRQPNEGRSTTKKVATSDTKAPSPPAKSKLRSTPARSTTANTKPTDKQQPVGGTDDTKKKITDETKKKVNRIPRVALLANPPNKALPEEQKDPLKQKSKISRGSIARLSAPTASSARRRQSTTSSPVTTEPVKGTSAVSKPDQRRKRSDTSDVPVATAAPTTSPIAEAATEAAKDAEAEVTGEKPTAESSSTPDPVPTQLAEITIEKTPESDLPIEKRTAMPRRVGGKMLIIEKAKATTGDTTTTATATIAPPALMEKDRPTPVTTTESHLPESEKERSPQSPAESSTTSSRPHTPVQPHGSPTTTATTTTGLVTLDTASATPIKSVPDQQQQFMGNTSKVKDILGRFM